MSLMPFIKPTAAPVSYEIIGAGGAGGFGRADKGEEYRGTYGASGGLSSVDFPTGTVTSAGATGGENCEGARGATGFAGAASVYGAGGGVTPRNTHGYDAPATSYGAGGAGGGGDGGGTYDSGGCSGGGGNAATQQAGTAIIPYGTTLTIIVGAKALGVGQYSGGDGAKGYVKLIVDGTTHTYTTAGTFTLEVT